MVLACGRTPDNGGRAGVGRVGRSRTSLSEVTAALTSTRRTAAPYPGQLEVCVYHDDMQDYIDQSSLPDLGRGGLPARLCCGRIPAVRAQAAGPEGCAPSSQFTVSWPQGTVPLPFSATSCATIVDSTFI